MMCALPLRHRALLTAPLLSAALLGCGGGSSEPEAIPLYAGTYFVVMDKTVDSCNSRLANRVEVIQTVSQSGRDVTLVSHLATLHGEVDGDDLGISTSSQSLQNGVWVTNVMVYRATDTPGLFGAGLSIVNDAGNNQRCTIAYNGQAQLQ